MIRISTGGRRWNGCVDDLGIGGNDEISADAYDLTAVDEDSAFGDDAVCNGMNGAVDDG